MNTAIKNKAPLIFLICISIFWCFYYQTSNSFNDFGASNFEWLYLVDSLLVMPLLCFIWIENKKEAALKATLLGCLAIIIGSFIIPEQSKVIWHSLESGRYLILVIFLIFEVIAILTVYLAIKTALQKDLDPDIAIAVPIQRMLGKGVVAQLFVFETRMWAYAIFAKRIKSERFYGETHFSYHLKDGAQSNSFGFILLILFELPVMHLLLHFIWSPWVANLVTLLTLLSLIFFIAEYRAMSRRPISVDKERLIIRYGIYNVRTVLLKDIKSISKTECFIPRSKSVKRYNFSGFPNIAIYLKQSDGDIERIYLGVDNPKCFFNAIEQLNLNQFDK